MRFILEIQCWFSMWFTTFEYSMSNFNRNAQLLEIRGNVLNKLSEVAQLCLTLCDPMDCSLPGSSIHGIFQARVLEWVAISFSRESSQPRDQIRVSLIVGRCFYCLSHQRSQNQMHALKTRGERNLVGYSP